MQHIHRKLLLALTTLAVCLAYFAKCSAQTVPSTLKSADSVSEPAVNCVSVQAPLPVTQALRLACLRTPAAHDNISLQKAIIIGFVGGFVRRDDPNHPEVHFARFLSENYPSIRVEVFANHDGASALRSVLQFLDIDKDRSRLDPGKQQANIIIYGHSWGASQAVTLARQLGRLGVPVSLTIQVDSVRKPGQDDSTIPDNVSNAVNLYQTQGLIHGQSAIRAADPQRTNIIGNIHMTYERHEINCNNYPLLARVFNRGHHQIENDPHVWEEVESLIDAEVSSRSLSAEALRPSCQSDRCPAP
jgi:pimeloyl-ACP methyl ester carboxylesterase